MQPAPLITNITRDRAALRPIQHEDSFEQLGLPGTGQTANTDDFTCKTIEGNGMGKLPGFKPINPRVILPRLTEPEATAALSLLSRLTSGGSFHPA